MLLSLFHWLSGYVRAFAVFDYLSLRAVLAALTALVIGLAFGPFTIRELKKLHFGQAVRTDGPKSHLKKDGTPTMGGILILASIAISTLLWVDLSNRYIWVVLLVTLGLLPDVGVGPVRIHAPGERETRLHDPVLPSDFVPVRHARLHHPHVLRSRGDE